MTREDAINYFKGSMAIGKDDATRHHNEVLEFTIKALEQEPCDDKVRDKKMNYKSFNLGDWIGHISGAIEDERELDGNEMRDLVEFLTILNKELILDKLRDEIIDTGAYEQEVNGNTEFLKGINYCLGVIDKYKVKMEREKNGNI